MIRKFTKSTLLLAAVVALAVGMTSSCNTLSTLGKLVGTWTLGSSNATNINWSRFTPATGTGVSSNTTETRVFDGSSEVETTTSTNTAGGVTSTTIQEVTSTYMQTVEFKDDGTFTMTETRTVKSGKDTDAAGNVSTWVDPSPSTTISTYTGMWNYDRSNKVNNRLAFDGGGSMEIVENKKGSLVLANYDMWDNTTNAANGDKTESGGSTDETSNLSN